MTSSAFRQVLGYRTKATKSAPGSQQRIPFADFTHLPTRWFIALMRVGFPQLPCRAEAPSTFHLRTRAEAVDDRGRPRCRRARQTPRALECVRLRQRGGRHSTVHAPASREDIGAPMDVLWFRLPKKASDPGETMGRFTAGRIVILIDRGEYWQCAFLIRKGAIEETKRAGLPAFRQSIAQIMPVFADRVDELKDWDQVKLLTVAVGRLERWHRPGLLCIGDAAHAMSPIGGVGVNLAVQDAVAAANILWQPLKAGTLREDDLDTVQERREFPTRVTQRMQVFIQDKVINAALATEKSLQAPLPLRLMSRFALLRRVPARLVGVGVRPEHVHTPDMLAAGSARGAANPRSLPA